SPYYMFSSHPSCSSLFFTCYAYHRDLHSFPTRRSSDLRFRKFFKGINLIFNPLIIVARLFGHQPGNLRGHLNTGFGIQKQGAGPDRKSTRLNSSHVSISYAVFCLKKKKKTSTREVTMSS